MTQSYRAESIEVLSGLDPVRKRPGMYTYTSNPNHMAQEVIDNSVDEVLSGYASNIHIILYADGALEVSDNGRGMPVDLHPEYGISGVELILTRLHAGGKFSNKNYVYSGGLHGVGVSVVNALSKRVEVEIDRDGARYQLAFEKGEIVESLKKICDISARKHGTRVKFWVDPDYFDQADFKMKSLMHLLRAKAVLCPGLKITLSDQKTGHQYQWEYVSGIQTYFEEACQGKMWLAEPFSGHFKNVLECYELDWIFAWSEATQDLMHESYVNLIPTAQGGTHVNGLRLALSDAVREFCQHHALLPKGVKLLPDDVFYGCHYLLSIKMQEPQFSGQTKERLSSRECAAMVSNGVRDAFSLWLNQHVEAAKNLISYMIERAQQRLKQQRL